MTRIKSLTPALIFFLTLLDVSAMQGGEGDTDPLPGIQTKRIKYRNMVREVQEAILVFRKTPAGEEKDIAKATALSLVDEHTKIGKESMGRLATDIELFRRHQISTHELTKSLTTEKAREDLEALHALYVNHANIYMQLYPVMFGELIEPNENLEHWRTLYVAAFEAPADGALPIHILKLQTLKRLKEGNQQAFTAFMKAEINFTTKYR